MFSAHCEFQFFPNRIRLSNGRTGQTIGRSAPRPFSSEQRLIADKEEASRFVREILRESNGKRRSFTLWPTAAAKIVDGPSTQNDREEVRELLADQGFVRVSVS